MKMDLGIDKCQTSLNFLLKFGHAVVKCRLRQRQAARLTVPLFLPYFWEIVPSRISGRSEILTFCRAVFRTIQNFLPLSRAVEMGAAQHISRYTWTSQCYNKITLCYFNGDSCQLFDCNVDFSNITWKIDLKSKILGSWIMGDFGAMDWGLTKWKNLLAGYQSLVNVDRIYQFSSFKRLADGM